MSLVSVPEVSEMRSRVVREGEEAAGQYDAVGRNADAVDAPRILRMCQGWIKYAVPKHSWD